MNMTCLICKENRYLRSIGEATSLYSTRPYKLTFCENCHHIFISDPPSESELNALYRERYNYESHLAIKNEKKWRSSRTVSILKKLIPVNTKIIEVGCMYCFSLEVLRNLGYSDLVGIEIDALAVRKCRGKNFTVFEGTFDQWLHSESGSLTNGNVCILMSHVIEHIQDIDRFLTDVKQVLRSGSYLFLLVPNSGARTMKLFKKYWGWWQVPVHLHHFSRNSLHHVLSSNGFEIELSSLRGADSLFWLSTLASFLGMKSESQKLSSFQRIIIKSFSSIAKYWFYSGDEELIVVAKKK